MCTAAQILNHTKLKAKNADMTVFLTNNCQLHVRRLYTYSSDRKTEDDSKN